MGILDKLKKLMPMLNKHKLEKSEDKTIQQQVAGDGSHQTQIGTFIINQGISEGRARNIYTEMSKQTLEKHTNEAHKEAMLRIEKLENELMPKVSKLDHAMQAFADPAFQLLLRKAQQSAASTERKNDYELLSELLICHIQEGENRINRTGIAKAVEIVDRIDNNALCGLTIVHAINRFTPNNGGIDDGLAVLDKLFSKISYLELPTGTAWIDHLDVLGAVRMSTLAPFIEFREYYSEELNGYACVGIKENSPEHKKAIQLITNAGLSTNLLVPHELLDGYVRLALMQSPHKIKNIPPIASMPGRLLTDAEAIVLNEIWKLYSKDNRILNQVKNEFIRHWDAYGTLKKIRLWWESIPCSFELTIVGTVLAHTNAKRCDPNLPDLL